MCGRCYGGIDPCRRRHFGLYVDPRPTSIRGDIYRDRFWEVWEQRFEPFRNREWARRGECADCAVFRYCQGGGMHLHDDDGSLLYCHYKRL